MQSILIPGLLFPNLFLKVKRRKHLQARLSVSQSGTSLSNGGGHYHSFPFYLSVQQEQTTTTKQDKREPCRLIAPLVKPLENWQVSAGL